MPEELFLSVVIPSYNEQTNLDRGVLDQVLEYLKHRQDSWELILTDDGSTDGTTQQLLEFQKKDPRIKVLENVHAGKAPTVAAGMLAAKGQWRLFTDFDQSTPIQDVEKLMRWAKKGHQVVIGSREIFGAEREKEPFHRHFMGRVFNLMVQIIAMPGILDTQCGFKLFSSEATELLFKNLHVYGGKARRKDPFTGAFDVELLFLAKLAGFSVIEVPVKWMHNKSDRVNPIKDSIRMLIDILKIRSANLKGKYKVVKDYARELQDQ